MAKYNIHAGHNPDGKVACGACGIIKESTEARKVVKYLIEYIKSVGHTVYDCTCNDGTSQSDVLVKIVKKCNQHTNIDLDVSIHFNSGASDEKGNGKTTGVEVLINSDSSKAKPYAARICKKVSALGFKNRGVKVRNDLYVLKHTNAPALLVECCFVDDKDDCNLYNAKKIAKAIAEAILYKSITATKTTTTTTNSSSEKPQETEQPTIRVRVITDELNIRKGPGTKYDVVGKVKRNDVYTIVDNSGNWGKLKSGAGWINISEKYCQKI